MHTVSRRIAQPGRDEHGLRSPERTDTLGDSADPARLIPLDSLQIGPERMNDVIQIDLSEHERDILLKGLNFVRRSVMLETREPSANDELRRSGLLDEIHNLAQRLDASTPFSPTKV